VGGLYWRHYNRGGTWYLAVVDHPFLAASGSTFISRVSLAATLMGLAGGLTMSAIKRDRGVKDFGTTIEGHGGILVAWAPSVSPRHSSFISRDGYLFRNTRSFGRN
jgi:hypothetical protein